jgi:hypothetical protein
MSPRPMLNFFKVTQTAVCMKERKIPAAGSFRVATVYTPQFQSVRERTNAIIAAPTPPPRKKRRMHRKSMHAPLATNYSYFSYRSTVSVTVVVCVIPPPLAVIVIV